MPQNLTPWIAKNPAGNLAPLQEDVVGNLTTTAGGTASALDVTAAHVVKATPGRLNKIVVNGVVGTGGSLTINDCATTGAASAANEILIIAGTVAVGTVINLDWPCLVGLVISAVPTGGTAQFAVSFT